MIFLNKMSAVLLVASLQLIMISCKSSEPSDNVIDIDNAESATLLMSDYFESIEYIPLEASEKSLIGRLQHVHVSDEFIVVVSSGSCHVFNRRNGKFIRKIGMKGNGPKEYNSLVRGLSINEDKKTILAARATGAIEYSLIDGSVVEPGIKAKVPQFFIGKYMYIADDVWVKGELNYAGDSRNQLYFFDNEKVIDSIANTSFYTPKGGAISINLGELYFYRYNNNAFLKFAYNDTIFNITNRTKEPKWILKTQNSLSEIAALRGDPQKMNEESPNYHFIYNIHETDNYLLFNSSYEKQNLPFLFLKDKQQLVKVENEGFVNDIDGGLTFWPKYTTSSQDVISVHEAHSFIEKINDGNQVGDVVENSPKSENLKTLLSKIDDDSNPIIVIARPKK